MSVKSYIDIPLLPGPVSVPGPVLEALNRDYGTDELGPEFADLYGRTAKDLAQLAATGSEVVIMTGEGMLGLWGALKSCLRPGDRVLAVGTGVFGDGLGQMAASFGCEVKFHSLPYNQTIGQEPPDADCPRPGGDAAPGLDALEDAVRAFKPKMITAVHCETPSGTLNPMAGLGEIKRATGTPLLCVDAVASWGGAPVEADRHGIDLLLGGSQKCLSAPPSLTFIGISPQAWEVIEQRGYQGYEALGPWRDVQNKGICPYTPYWQGLAALHRACALILEEGPENCYARHRRCAEMCRAGLLDLGVALFAAPGATPAPTVTAAYVPRGKTWAAWRRELLENGLAVAGSFGPMENQVFRLGHMGAQADEALLRRALAVMAKTL